MFAPWAAALVDLLVECVVKSMLLIAVVGVVLWALRVTDANLRHRTWTVVLLTMLALPALGWMLPAIEVPGWLSLPTSEIAQVEATHLPVDASGPLLSEQVSPQVMPILATAAESTAASTLPVTESRTATQESPAKVEHAVAPVLETSISWQTAVAVVYLAVAAVLIVRLGLGMALTWRMMRRGRRLTDADHAAFAGQHIIVQSSDVRTPATVGIWHPTILLPCDWGSWSDSAVELAIAHELSHARRRDALTTLLANGNAAVYWFHPLAWWLRRKLADLAEQVCDDEVLRTHGDRACYAETLLTMASRLTGQERASPLLVPMARRAQVETRIEAVIDARRPLCRRLGWRGLAMLLATAVPVVTSIAALQPAGTVAAEDAEQGKAANPTHQRGEEGTTKEEASRQRERPESSTSATGPLSKPPAAAGIVAGRVVSDADGSAISGAEVRLTGWNENRTRYDQKTVVSDAQGKFRFDDLPDGNLQVIALKENLASRTERYHGLKVMSGDEALELRMKPVPALRLKVVDKATQKPLAGAMVRLTWTDGVRDHTTGNQGEVLIRGLTPELWTIEVFADGHAEREEAIQLNGTDTTTITVALEPGFALQGAVVDEEQKPLKGVGISVFPRDFRGGQIEYLKTDDEGKYRFGHLPLVGLQLGFSKDNFADQRLDVAPEVEAGKVQRLDVTLSPRRDGGFVEGRVVDTAGQGIVGARVTNVGRSSRDVREAFTDADGRFRLDNAFQGIDRYTLVVKSPGYAPRIAGFSPGTHEEPTKVEVILKPGHRLRGRVVDEQGTPLAGIYVGFDGQVGFGSDGDGGFVVTEADGKFKFDTLPADVRFDIRSYNTAGKFSTLHEHKLPLDREEEVVVTLPPEGVMRGRVVDAATGKPLPTFVANVTFSPDRTNDDPNGTLFGPRSTGEGETFSSPQGEFRMGSFAQGMPLQVTIEADGYERAVVRRVVARRESEAESVEFRLLPIEKGELVSFAGRVVDQAGKGVSGIELRLIVSSERRAIPRDKFPFNWEMVRSGGLGKVAEVKQFLSATTNREGRFEFRNVMPGADMELAWWGSGVSQDRMPRLEKLDEADRQNLRIEITATGIVVGKFNRERFPDVDDVALSGNGDFFRGRLNGKDATYRIENVPPGNYELQLYRNLRKEGSKFLDAELLHREQVEVKSGETTVVDVGSEHKTPKTLKRQEVPRAPVEDIDEHAAQREPVAQEGDVVIRGNVTDDAGQAVAGALLILPTKLGHDGWSAEATSEESGEFELRVPAAEAAPGPYTPGWSIWCYHPDRQLATASAYQHLQRETAESISIVLQGATDTGFVVTAPSGVPVSNALVEPVHFLAAAGAYDIVPERMQKLMSGRTDLTGRMHMPTIGREGFKSVQVTATGFGVQMLDLDPHGNAPALRNIQLRLAGRIEGQLVADEPSLLAGVRIGFMQTELGRDFTTGEALVTTDGEGRFVVPEFAEGQTKVYVSTNRGDPLLPRVPEEVNVFAGETTSVEIQYERAVTVTGHVQAEDGRKVPDALVSIRWGAWHQGAQVRTDSNGRFTANVLPGEVRQQLIMRPKTFYYWIENKAGWQSPIEVPDDAQEFELPPIELIPTVSRRGQLINAAGQPLVGMRISAVTENRVYSNAKSEEKGHFELHLPENLKVDQYTIHDDAGLRMVAEVISVSPLVLRVGK